MLLLLGFDTDVMSAEAGIDAFSATVTSDTLTFGATCHPSAAIKVRSVCVSPFICPGGLLFRKASGPAYLNTPLGPACGAQSPKSPLFVCALFQLAKFVWPPSIEK